LVVGSETRTTEHEGRVLSRSGYQVLHAVDGPQALAIVRRSSPVHLVLANIGRDVTKGVPITDADILRLSPSTATLFISSRSTAARVLWKPSSAAVLLRRVEQALTGASQARRALENALQRAREFHLVAEQLLRGVDGLGRRRSDRNRSAVPIIAAGSRPWLP
jgi:DNA-binding response OmpR family regulator